MTRERHRKRSRIRKSLDGDKRPITTLDALQEFDEYRGALREAEQEVVQRIKEMRKGQVDLGPRAGKDPAYIWSDGLSEN